MTLSGGRAVELILDASGSMRTDDRIGKAKGVLKRIVKEDLPDDIPVALRVFGAKGGCDTELVTPLTPLTAAKRTELVTKIEAVAALGDTAIAASLDAVKDDLASATGLRHVVLVTDGGETCGGDVKASLENLKKLGIDVQVDVVGIAPPESSLHAEFQEWAEVTGGSYLGTNDSPQMREALKKVLIDEAPASPEPKEEEEDRSRKEASMAEYTAGALGLDYFQFYDVDNQSAGDVIRLQCQFDRKMEKAQLLCTDFFANPTSKNGQPIYDENAHFTWYKLLDPLPDPQRDVVYVNQFGENRLITGRCVALLSPTWKVEAGSSFPENLDHYRVFEVLDGEPSGAQLELEDQFGAGATRISFPRFFAVPATKVWKGETFEIKNPDAHLVIYATLPRTVKKAIQTRDQFSSREQHCFRSVLLGAPTRKVDWRPRD